MLTNVVDILDKRLRNASALRNTETERTRRRDQRLQMSSHRNGQCAARAGGFTLAELIVSTTILFILRGMAQSLAAFAVRCEKERVLRNNLRTIREAIDRYQEGSP